MANHTITASSITVHGRGSLILPFKLRLENGDQIDISARPIFFEVDGVPIREQLLPDPADPLGLILTLERTQIITLGTAPCAFVFVDERRSQEDIYEVLWAGTINRSGYVGTPDEVAG
ncbi:hypothetical protein GRI62_11780 [Erythrobacter arachoides]|uniref:Uncharacterized protein n=1 Tax=Aurantiacibacter arachoides TaxID=1850444 RepID=A0A845A2A8_9SPHN|nr:hypothetical protein [Aurantiacibacter arachoides]MXO94275.1 hypothetical protein [Aurantiacibacter arachoides]GGD64760.1 hypothetical protein GCM10011411_26330 [Aurantiacibacter arachoides]